MNIEELAFLTEILAVFLINIICVLSAVLIYRKNSQCKINCYVAIGLLFASLGTWGTLVRALVFRFTTVSYMSEFGITTRHIDTYLAFGSVYFFYCAFWLLFQDPESNLPPKIRFVPVPVILLMIFDLGWGSWINSFASHIFAFLSILLTLVFIILSVGLVHRMSDKVPKSKIEKIHLLTKGLILTGVGFIFIVIGGGIRAFGFTEQLRYLVYITQSVMVWVVWFISAIYLYKGSPTRETYFFDELNQILVYKLDLPLDTNLDELFGLFEKSVNQTRQELLNELKKRSSISEYLEEISKDFNKMRNI